MQLGAGVAIVLAAATRPLGFRHELSRFGYQWLGPREQDLHTSAPPYMDWDIHGMLFGALALFVGTVCLAAPTLARRQLRRRQQHNQRPRCRRRTAPPPTPSICAAANASTGDYADGSSTASRSRCCVAASRPCIVAMLRAGTPSTSAYEARAAVMLACRSRCSIGEGDRFV